MYVVKQYKPVKADRKTAWINEKGMNMKSVIIYIFVHVLNDRNSTVVQQLNLRKKLLKTV